MGAELAKAYAPARAVFAEIDEALGQSLSTLIWVGPEDQLTLTENAQPALMAVSLAVIRVLEAEKGFSLKESVTFVAGHSLGESSALAAAGSLSLADTARLLKTRGQAMQAAVPVGEGAMAALLGADPRPRLRRLADPTHRLRADPDRPRAAYLKPVSSPQRAGMDWLSAAVKLVRSRLRRAGGKSPLLVVVVVVLHVLVHFLHRVTIPSDAQARSIGPTCEWKFNSRTRFLRNGSITVRKYSTSPACRVADFDEPDTWERSEEGCPRQRGT